MERRKNKKYSNNWNNQKKSEQNKAEQYRELNNKKDFHLKKAVYEDSEAEKKIQQAIKEIKSREVICPKCGQPITDVSSAITDKESGKPAHFDCILNQLKQTEQVGENEKIAYIGQGRFAVIYYENPRDQRHFTIKKIIEWEERDKKPEWRSELSGLYSQIN
ncbi:hypothetical protein [Treponema sp. Marseille-Q3903]|uniref:hypothetical protein n=1 Tax=Treponema sp. Marseille-Q3903 TaxID=2766703 RepID=UPI001651CB78|nr:hypothetical protein [Treponema sp. Marseille-Q3903]MBC6713324.1 hypothetical protein [Treponema sp. Marseille-Q3903]